MPDAALRVQRDVQAVDEHERIEWLQRTVSPLLHLLHDAVCDMGNLFVRHLETIDVLDGGGDVMLAHAPSVQGEDLAFDGGDIALVLLDDLRLEGAPTVTGHADGDFSQGRLESFFGVSIAGIAIGIRAFMVCIAEMALHLSFECRFEDRREDALDDILNLLGILGMIGFHNLLGDSICRSRGDFAFCHAWNSPPARCSNRA
ncbi:hypothetical protein APV24_00095 [Campylobacter jejuni]|nr:hypothetical protein APV24_00095 [Campylobacter jejuni]